MENRVYIPRLYICDVIRWLTVFLLIMGVFFRPLTILAFIIAAVWIVIEDDYSKLYVFLFFLMPYAGIFKYTNGSSSLFTYLELIIVLKLLVYRKYTRNFFFAWFLFSIYVFLGMGNEYNTAIKQMCIPVLFYNCLQDEIRGDLSTYIKAYSISVFISSFLGVFKRYLPALAALVNSKQTRMDSTQLIYADRFSGLWGDPNYYSVNILLCLGLIIFLHIKGLIKPFWAFLGYSLIVVFGAMTGSKSFILVLALVLILFFFELLKNKRYAIASILAAGCITCIYLALNGNIEIFNTTLTRLSSVTSAADLTTERSTLWMLYLKNFWNHPFKAMIGIGVGGEYSFYNAPHNTYIDFIEVFGVIGTLLFTLCMLFSCDNKPRERKFVNWIPMIILLIMYFSLSMITYLDFVFQLMLAVMSVYYIGDSDDIYERRSLVQ